MTAICSSCGVDFSGRPLAPFVVNQRRRGDFLACQACHAEYMRQCEVNARDEERERAQRAERLEAAAKRDQARTEKQRSNGTKENAA